MVWYGSGCYMALGLTWCNVFGVVWLLFACLSDCWDNYKVCSDVVYWLDNLLFLQRFFVLFWLSLGGFGVYLQIVVK